MPQIICIMVSGFSLTVAMRDQLVFRAVEMYKMNKSKQIIKADDFEGMVQTDFRHVALGGVSGINFSAEIESTRGKIFVRYLVRVNDLEKGGLMLWSDSEAVEKASWN